MQALLKPVKDEEARLEAIAGEELVTSSAINRDGDGTTAVGSDGPPLAREETLTA